MNGLPPSSTLFPYTTLFRSLWPAPREIRAETWGGGSVDAAASFGRCARLPRLRSRGFGRSRLPRAKLAAARSEEHTSELQSRQYLVCRLLLEKKKKI